MYHRFIANVYHKQPILSFNSNQFKIINQSRYLSINCKIVADNKTLIFNNQVL